MTVRAKRFDTAVSSTTGDVMLLAINPAVTVSPVIINPGHSAIIKVTIKPSGASGTKVRGTLYVDDLIQRAALRAVRRRRTGRASYTYTIK